MRRESVFILCYVGLLSVCAGLRADEVDDAARSVPAASDNVAFAQQIRPILTANCFACHGPDEEAREADLRLDVREVAVDYGAIVPGDTEASLLIERIATDDPDLKMPPPDSGFALTGEQIGLIKQWIAEGAEYSEHWAFVPPKRPDVPAVHSAEWPDNEIDYFILHKLEQAGLQPADRAEPHVLVRRLFLDLTGLPPAPEVADKFAADPTDEAYEALVDELLASPRFGEHWARVWLDLARYADTKGYEKDLPRDMWPYRDWLIRAINDDMPYDQMTIEQLAGDLLREPSRDQLIATAFHRNTMANDEGGTDDEEFRVAAVKDRVDTTMQVWMGLTAGCAKCHSHKFDPISHEEYYQLVAIFNQTEDADRYDEAPVLRCETAEQRQTIKALEDKIAALKPDEQASDAGATDQDDARATAVSASNDAESASPNADGSKAKNQPSELAKLEEQLKDFESKVVKLPIMRELEADKRRASHVHVRGNFLEKGAEVSPQVPAAFGTLPDGAPPDRLALAKWLVADENPLTARVAANRVWARFFGTGLVESEGDFGSQGAAPSHPELLDWIATEYRDTHEWSLKKFSKTIVMSAAYRQSSDVDAAKLAADPRNRLFSRGPRFRLTAEIVRDQTLAASSLLSSKMYGPPVMPPQPPGVWKSIYNALKWQTSEGEDRYRRALYTYWKRTSPYPAMMVFDAESREVCSIRRIHTNTPLQALVLLNDPVYLEAAGALARRMIDEGGSEPERRIARGFRRLLIRPPASHEIDRLEQLRRAAEQNLRAEPKGAAELLESCGAAQWLPESMNAEEFASYVVVASVLLNLDESVTRT